MDFEKYRIHRPIVLVSPLTKQPEVLSDYVAQLHFYATEENLKKECPAGYEDIEPFRRTN